ncbi:LOW QUALITY PROTEIN: myelin basic protein-like [Trichomycterus rosablanca]|uniref:LOW QUALITY PROTEIN: myelin basic protein-like n=1 Tax=Trichomycterus rosablanca TaxID=2290929 RepID=UPI002F35CFB8
MGQPLGKRELSPETKVLSEAAPAAVGDGDGQDEVFGLNNSDVNQNKNRLNKSEASPGSALHAPPSTGQTNRSRGSSPRSHLVRLFSRDAPGREDNTFKERPSESDELQTIEEAGAAASENSETTTIVQWYRPPCAPSMASSGSSGQSGFRLGRSSSKKNPGMMDQIGKIFGGDKKRKGKGSFRGALSASPQRSSHSSPRRRPGDNAVVHFFRTMVSPAAAPKSRGVQKGQGSQKSQKGKAGEGTLTRIFKMGGSRAASPAKR